MKKNFKKILWNTIYLHSIFNASFLYLIAPGKKRHKPYKELIHWDYAHRGFFNNLWGAPENSIPAFKYAIDKGYGIELDVHKTLDGHLIIHHDDSLLRMCNVNRPISDLTLSEIKELQLLHTSEKIPEFNDVLELVDGRVPLIIELKCGATAPDELCALVYDALKEYKGLYCIESFNPMVVRWFKKNHPSIIRGQLSCDFYKESPHCDMVLFSITYLLTNILARPDFIAYKCTDTRKISFRINRHFFHPMIVLWGVNNEKQYEHYSKIADTVIFEGFEPIESHSPVTS